MDAKRARSSTGSPAACSTLLKAALPVVPGVNQLPGIARSRRDDFAGPVLRPHRRRGRRAPTSTAYAAVCGFPRKDTVPLPYPHLLAFPLHMAIMTDPAFPYPAIGTVHLENSITAAPRRSRSARCST